MSSKNYLLSLHEKSNSRGVFSILIEWSLIFITIFSAIKVDSNIFSALSLFFIAGRQHALAFCVHEGVHFLVLKNKKYNDIFVNYFAAWPLFLEIKTYRGNHLAHHRHNNTDKDPDWVRKRNSEWRFPKTKMVLMKDFIKSLLGLESMKTFYALSGVDAQKKGLAMKYKISISIKLQKTFYYLALMTIFSVLGLWEEYLFFWVLPQFSILQVLNRIRKISEHFGIPHLKPELDYQPSEITRTVNPSLIERIFIAPKNISYHSEHHLYPQVPYYNLVKLHKVLVSNKPVKFHITNGYLNVIKECMQTKNKFLNNQENMRRKYELS